MNVRFEQIPSKYKVGLESYRAEKNKYGGQAYCAE